MRDDDIVVVVLLSSEFYEQLLSPFHDSRMTRSCDDMSFGAKSVAVELYVDSVPQVRPARSDSLNFWREKIFELFSSLDSIPRCCCCQRHQGGQYTCSESCRSNL